MPPIAFHPLAAIAMAILLSASAEAFVFVPGGSVRSARPCSFRSFTDLRVPVTVTGRTSRDSNTLLLNKISNDEQEEQNIWFSLVNANGKPFKEVSGPTTVEIPSAAHVADLRNAVKLRFDNPGYLKDIDAFTLKVFKNKAAFDANESLKAFDAISGMGQPEDPLWVLVPQSTSSLNGQTFEAVVGVSWPELMTIADQLDQNLERSVGNLIEVPEGTKSIFGTAFDNGLFVRQEYADIIQIIYSSMATDPSIDRILLIGSPGIGKSVFGVLLFLLAVKERKNVAFGPKKSRCTYWFTWNGSGYEISTAKPQGLKYEGYFDGTESRDALTFAYFRHAFLFASPRTTNYNEFVKDYCLTVYMNPWSKQECQKFAELIRFSDEDEWVRRFNLVGGKPRFLFSSTVTHGALVNMVKGSIPRSLSQLREHAGRFEQDVFDDSMKHILYQMYRDEDSCDLYYLTYSSLAVEAMINDRFKMLSASSG